MFNALVVEKTETGTQADLRQISYDDLPAGDVTVAVDYSTVNYKDGLCIGPNHFGLFFHFSFNPLSLTNRFSFSNLSITNDLSHPSATD